MAAATQNVRLINQSRYALELIAIPEGGGAGKRLRIGARSRLDLEAEEWKQFEDCNGAVQYRDKLRWLIVAKQAAKAKKGEGLASMTSKLAIEQVNMTLDALELHAWLEAEKRSDVKKVIEARLLHVANDLKSDQG